MSEKKETTWDKEERLKKQRYENALAFLEKCKGEGLTIYEVEKTVEVIQSALKHRVTLNSGLKE